MTQSLRTIAFQCSILFMATHGWCVEWESALQDNEFMAFLNQGQFATAETLLRERIGDLNAPVTTKPAIQLEILRRIRLAFPYTDDTVLSEIQRSIPGATLDDVRRWRESGELQHRMIDGKPRYFERAVSNLFRFSGDARARRDQPQESGATFDLVSHVADVVRRAEQHGSAEVYPVKHKVRYVLSVAPGHPRIKPGAVVRAWLPFPQEYRQQRNVRLLRTNPADVIVADNGVPHRTLYFTQTIGDPTKPPRFEAEFEFVTSGVCHDLDPSKVQPYKTSSKLYQEFTATRPPHILVTPEVQRLANEIVGTETNPLLKVRKLFRWTSDNIPWCAELEYCVIPSLSEKGLTARKGDCGVQGLVFVTLCRAAGVPARWQSGFQLKPNNWNLHDWSEIYVEPWGWLPADASYGMLTHDDPRVQYFFCGGMDPYRFIVNLDYGRLLVPEKTSFRSEPNDFQRGEIEIDGHNLYFDEWDWQFEITSEPEVTNHAGPRSDSP